MKYLNESGLLYLWGKLKTALDGKVDIVAGKGLSTEDYTSTEKTKLLGIAENANNYSHPTTAGNKHIPTGGASGNFLKYSASGTAIWATPFTPTTAELTVLGWSSNVQTATVMGVRDDPLQPVLLSPDPADFDAYVAAKIKVTGQGTNSISFSCGSVPSVAITVNVLIVG